MQADAPTIDLVVFDIGGVMIRLDPQMPLMRDAWRERFIELVSQHEVGRMDDDLFLGQLAETSGFSSDEVHTMIHAWIVEPYPGIEELVNDLTASPVQTACLSNTNGFHWPRMHDPGHETSLPLAQLDHRFASHLVGMRKPNQEVYRHVEQSTGVAPERIAFFDDSEMNIQAAKQSGWQAVRVDPTGDAPGQVRAWLGEQNVL